MYRTGESIQSWYSFSRLTTCQLSGRSSTRPVKRARFAASRGRLAQNPVPTSGSAGAPPATGPLRRSKRSLFIRIGCRPRDRNSRANEVFTTAYSLSPHEPSFDCASTICAASTRYQSCLPKYLNPLASPTRSTP
jgi:hypothetical protein